MLRGDGEADDEEMFHEMCKHFGGWFTLDDLYIEVMTYEK